MSKEKPEVGDVWIYNWNKYYIIQTKLLKDRTRVLLKIDKIYFKQMEVSPEFFEEARYLGKSKANINDLFEVEK